MDMIINYCPHCMHNNTTEGGLCDACGKSLTINNDPHQLPVNTILRGRYLVGKCIGQGGFGITYIGVDLETEERVAIKEFYPSGLANRHSGHALNLTVSQSGGVQSFELGKSKFINEAKVLSKFDEQPNIVSVKDYFEDNSTAYIVMEYIDGKSLQELLTAKGRLSFDEAFSMLAPIMRGLGKVHEKGLIHRDISPSNIMMQRNGVMKLLDFGTARTMSQQGEHSLSIVLKPGFAPEEQYRSRGEQGPWTDVYAICATIYKLITGQTPENSLNRMFGDNLVLPSALGADITPRQEQVLLRGMAVHHSQRIQNMPQLYDEMCAVLRAPAGFNRDGGANVGGGAKEKTGAVTNTGTVTNTGGATDAQPGNNKPGKGKKGLLAVIGIGLAAVLIIALAGGGKKDERGGSGAANTPAPAISVTQEPRQESGGTELLRTIAGGGYQSAAVTEDGTVLVVGDNLFNQCETEGWTDVIAVTASTYTTVGLHSDGSISVSGSGWMQKGFENFYDIIDIDDNSECIVGLRADGTVATNRDGYFDEVRNWTGIVDISAGDDHVAGLRADGTVIVENWDLDTDPKGKEAESWNNIVAISSGSYHVAGLRADGTVVTTLRKDFEDNSVSQWRDIVQIAAGCNVTIGLKADGTVVCSNSFYDLSGWTDIVQIAAGDWHVLGLRADGTVLSAGDNDDGRADVQGWRNIRIYD